MPVSLLQLAPSAQPFFAALLHRLLPNHTLVAVLPGLKAQELFQQDFETWSLFGEQSPGPNRRPLFYPPWEIFPHEEKLPHVDVISDRLATLVALTPKTPALVVTSVTALLQKTFAPGEIARRTRHFERGFSIDPLDLVEWLEEQGYEPEAQVTQRGEISLRGGIVDVWPLTSPWPVRLEFFGNDLESLRQFDPLTQISRDEITTVTIPPGGELGLLRRPAPSSAPPASLLDYLPDKTIFLFANPADLQEAALHYEAEVPEGDRFLFSWPDFLEQLKHRGLGAVTMSDAAEASPTDQADPLAMQGLEVFRPIGERAPDPQIADVQRRDFFQQMQRWLRQEYGVHVFCNNDGEKQRFAEVWQDYGLGDPPQIHLGALSRGFIFESARIVVVTDAEIFGRYKVQRARRLKSAHAQTSRSMLDIDFTELEEGDYVVHLQHGIGRYLGLKSLPASLGRRNRDGSLRSEEANAAGQECLVIEYGASDADQEPPRLYVPVTEAHLVSKYVGTGKARPALNTLGGTRWAKAKAQAEHAVRDLAAELLSIQAARASQPGHPFNPDNAWQREFEGSFLYEETPDQARAIVETKSDMESPRPMDRLICGDVGYGKTEVAIRAAFKAVMGGKQVAILVPTTVLAQQHFNTFRERMSDYPVRIELLSRFRTRREQTQVIENLAAGAVDIVIGTHRLVQSDIQFKDLGLVVIDEEQRFGVMHKEKFKLLRKLVDVLTLSATPIPRTLYLALTGARDMSTIETPPQDRLPVETIVMQYDERIIRDAIRREINRQGQVFFLHNRVSTIEPMALRLKELVPEARLLVGHGQMEADDLEGVMTKFVNGEADILLSTTIIESGLDIPNANTIIIDRADRFGLSELYQLRGRVGRYKHQAFAYLLLPRHASLLADVRKRITAIKQYSSLGSGFKIAMRDLEIRGAGNLLGSQQSGHITAVGFDLYCQLLKQSVGALKGEKVKPRVEVQIRLDFLALTPEQEAAVPDADSTAVFASAFIPVRYMAEPRHRIDVYRKLAQAGDKSDVEKLKRELRDRFGPIPPEVELLAQVAELKILAAGKQIHSIETRGDKLMLTRNGELIQLGGKFPRLIKPTVKGRLGEIKRLLLAI